MKTDQMRVAMISYHTCPLAILGGKDTGGMNVYVRELTRHLGKLGVHVDVYTRSQDEHVPHVIHDLGYGNRVVHVPAGPELPLPKDELATHLDSFSEWVMKFSNEKGLEYEMIHSHYWMSGLAARELKRAWNVPVLHMFHTLGIMKNMIAGDGEYEGEYRLRGENDTLDIVDKVIAATPAEQSQLEKSYDVSPDLIKVIPPGVDLSHFYPIPEDEAREYVGVGSDERLLLFVGRIEPLKGIDTLIGAMESMRQLGILKRHNVRLAVIGGDAAVSETEMSVEMARLQELSKKLDLGEIVTFLGKRSQDSLPYYYSAADMLVLPSRYESFGMVVLEAMACGTPVIASQVGGLVHLVEDGATGFLVPDQDAITLCERISQLLDSDTLLKQMGANATQAAQDFDWRSITHDVYDLYREVRQSTPRPVPERTP